MFGDAEEFATKPAAFFHRMAARPSMDGLYPNCFERSSGARYTDPETDRDTDPDTDPYRDTDSTAPGLAFCHALNHALSSAFAHALALALAHVLAHALLLVAGAGVITFGADGDSFYEYLLKGYLQGGKQEPMLWKM